MHATCYILHTTYNILHTTYYILLITYYYCYVLPWYQVAPEVVEPLSELSEKPPPPLITVSNPSPVKALAVEETLPDGDATVTDIAEAA